MIRLIRQERTAVQFPEVEQITSIETNFNQEFIRPKENLNFDDEPRVEELKNLATFQAKRAAGPDGNVPFFPIHLA